MRVKDMALNLFCVVMFRHKYTVFPGSWIAIFATKKMALHLKLSVAWLRGHGT